MKKILFIFMFFYSVYSYGACYKTSYGYVTTTQAQGGNYMYINNTWNWYKWGQINVSVNCLSTDPLPLPNPPADTYCYYDDSGNIVCTANPDPLGGHQCRDLFQKDGVAYTCNPNTNEATPIPYSNGTTIDPEDGKDVPNCNEGYSWESTINFPSQGSTDGGYNSYTCTKDAYNPDGSFTGDNGVVIGADGSVTTPNPEGGSTTVYVDGSTSTTHPDGSITTTPPTNTTGGTGTDSGTGTSGGSTGGTDSGSGSTTGGDSGTGSTGGTTGTDTGSGSTGGTDTGTTDTGGMGTDGTVGTTGGGTATGGGSTGGTDSGTTTDGTTGTDSGTGTTGGTTGTTEPTTGADSCNDSNMTLLEKTLCKVNNGLNTLPSDGGQTFSDKVTGVSSGSTSSYDGFMTFITDMRTSYNTFGNQITNTRQFFQEGFTFNPIRNIVNSSNLEQCLTVSVFGGHDVFLDFISPLIYIKPISTLIIQILMLIEVLRMCILTINYARSIF